MKHKSTHEWGREKAKKYADGGAIRSERTDYERAQRELRRNPPVTVLEDFVGRISPEKGNSNAVREAIRAGIGSRMRETGYNNMPYDDDRYRSVQSKRHGGSVKKRTT